MLHCVQLQHRDLFECAESLLRHRYINLYFTILTRHILSCSTLTSADSETRTSRPHIISYLPVRLEALCVCKASAEQKVWTTHTHT